MQLKNCRIREKSMESNDSQKVKIVFIGKSADIGGTGIYIDGNKIASINSKYKNSRNQKN